MLTNALRADCFFLIRAAGTALFLVTEVPQAFAQSDAGGIATATVAAFQAAEGTSTAIAAGVGYRVNRTLAIGVELTVIPDFATGEPDLPVSIASTLIYPAPIYRIESSDGHATIFTGNLRLTIPTRSARVSPYLVGGAGVGNVRDELSYSVDFRPPRILAGLPVPLPRIIDYPAIRETIRRTTTDVAITMGGGISLAMSDQWSLDGDARYVTIAGQRDIHAGRFGGGITYRF